MVTSVAMNDEWIVAGLVNHRIHVFSAETGAHVRTLVGHSQGVWCLALVTKGGSERTASRSSATNASPRVKVKTRHAGDASSSSGHRSFAASSEPTTPPCVQEGLPSDCGNGGYQSYNPGLGFPGMGMGSSFSFPQEGALPRFGPHLRPTDVCNASIGWGQASSLVVSGGCDRELKVWDVATGCVRSSLRCEILNG